MYKSGYYIDSTGKTHIPKNTFTLEDPFVLPLSSQLLLPVQDFLGKLRRKFKTRNISYPKLNEEYAVFSRKFTLVLYCIFTQVWSGQHPYAQEQVSSSLFNISFSSMPL